MKRRLTMVASFAVLAALLVGILGYTGLQNRAANVTGGEAFAVLPDTVPGVAGAETKPGLSDVPHLSSGKSVPGADVGSAAPAAPASGGFAAAGPTTTTAAAFRRSRRKRGLQRRRKHRPALPAVPIRPHGGAGGR